MSKGALSRETAVVAFKGVQSAVDSRPELRGIPEVPPVAGSRPPKGDNTADE